MRLSGRYCCCFLFTVYGFRVTEFWETKSLARLSDYDTTRGNVNGNIFCLEIYHWVSTSHFFFFPITCNFSYQPLVTLLLPYLLLHLGMHVSSSSQVTDQYRQLIKAEGAYLYLHWSDEDFSITCTRCLQAPSFINGLKDADLILLQYAPARHASVAPSISRTPVQRLPHDAYSSGFRSGNATSVL